MPGPRQGISTEGLRPKGVDEFLGRLPVDYLFIVCGAAAEACPTIWPGSPTMERIVCPFDDPAKADGTDDEKLAVFRRVRDEIRAKLADWLATLN